MGKGINKSADPKTAPGPDEENSGAKGKDKIREENIKKVAFPDLKEEENIDGKNSLSILNDIPLKVVVELGRTVLKIKDILELGVGSIVELDKLSGEPVDILINGERIARGEVVVIDEDFGVRVTDVVLDKGSKEENEKITEQ